MDTRSKTGIFSIPEFDKESEKQVIEQFTSYNLFEIIIKYYLFFLLTAIVPHNPPIDDNNAYEVVCNHVLGKTLPSFLLLTDLTVASPASDLTSVEPSFAFCP